MPLTTVPYLQTNFHATLQDPRPVGSAAIAWETDSFKRLRGDSPNYSSIPVIFQSPAQNRATLLTTWLDPDGVTIGSRGNAVDAGDGVRLDAEGTLLRPNAAAAALARLPLTWIQQPDIKCFKQAENTGNRVGIRTNSRCMSMTVAGVPTETRTLFLLDGPTAKIKQIWFFDASD